MWLPRCWAHIIGWPMKCKSQLRCFSVEIIQNQWSLKANQNTSWIITQKASLVSYLCCSCLLLMASLWLLWWCGNNNTVVNFRPWHLYFDAGLLIYLLVTWSAPFVGHLVLGDRRVTLLVRPYMTLHFSHTCK